MELGVDKLSEMIYKSTANGSIKVPLYNKSSFEGKGDRYPEDQWKTIDGKIDLVIVEGWMLGYKQVPEDDERLMKYTGEDLAQLKYVNTLMNQYEEKWHPFFDASILVGIDDPDIVYQWREEAENT